MKKTLPPKPGRRGAARWSVLPGLAVKLHYFRISDGSLQSPPKSLIFPFRGKCPLVKKY